MKRFRVIKHFGFLRLVRVLSAIYKHGFTLLALLDSAKDMYSGSACICDDFSYFSYPDFYIESHRVAYHLNKEFKIRQKSKVVIICSNSTASLATLFGASGLGADIFLLNPNQTDTYYNDFFSSQKPDVIISSYDMKEKISGLGYRYFCCDDTLDIPERPDYKSMVRKKKGSITVLSSGSSGQPKAESRKISAYKFLDPLCDILEKLNLQQNRSVLISVPVFHGYGLATLLLSVFLGQKIRLTKKFNAEKTLKILGNEMPDSWIVVPLMAQKVYSLGHNLPPIKRIIFGGDVLPAWLVKEIHVNGTEIYNLYGTSQTGICTIATDDDLRQYPDTIGKTIKGINSKVLNDDDQVANMGKLYIKCDWASDGGQGAYIPTGDVVLRNSNGYFFYKGRQDDMIVIGGENMYPLEIENVIYRYPFIKWIKARGVTDETGFKKIHIDIVPDNIKSFDYDAFSNWMDISLPRYMIPKSFSILKDIPSIKLM